MALPIFEQDIAYISKLDDYPNDVGGLSASELKARFDQAALELQEYINTQLIPQADEDIKAAALGVVVGGTTFNGSNLTPYSVGPVALSSGAVTSEKIANGAVTGEKLGQMSVGEGNLAPGSVSSAKLQEASVGPAALSNGAVTTGKIASGAVTGEKLAKDSVTGDKIAKGATFAIRTAVLSVSGWSNKTQTVSVDGMTGTETIIVSAAPEDFEDWCDARVYCSAQGENSLTFKCEDVPLRELMAYMIVPR